jgi:hypothetical protein
MILFQYLLKLSISLAVVFIFYHFVLRKLTFYNWNRCYLLGYSLLSFFIALIDISPVLEQQEWSESTIVQWVPVIQAGNTVVADPVVNYSLSGWQWMSLLVLTGIAVMLLRLLIQYFSYLRMTRKATPIAGANLPGSNMKLYQVDEDIIPFSFGNSIFINRHLHSAEELREIVWHEFIHVKQKHSFDIIAGELICMLNWYNPFAWLLRRSIRQNLEFIADDKVLENGVDRKEYQYLLLKVIGNKHFSIAPKFNFSSLKKRIAMMNKMKSAGVHIVKFLFILPLIAVLLVAFRNGYGDQPKRNQLFDESLTNTQVRIDTVPYVTTPNSKGYYIDVIGVNGECTVVVKDKKGKEIERVILNRWKEDKSFEEKYGEILTPPAPPTPPVAVDPAKPALPPAPPTPPVPTGACPDDNLATPVPDGVSGYNHEVRRISSEFEITNKKAWLKLKDGKEETYDLTNAKERALFESRYGKIINLNVNTTVAIAATPNVNSNVVTTIGTKVNTNVNTNVNPVATTEPDNVIAAVGHPVNVVSGGVNSVARTTPSNAARGTNVAVAPLTTTGVTIIDEGHVITGKENIIITITSKSTRQDLENFIKKMKEKGVELEYGKIEYDERGRLVHLEGVMRSGGSKSNFVVTDFTKLVLAMDKIEGKTWLKVHVEENEVI